MTTVALPTRKQSPPQVAGAHPHKKPTISQHCHEVHCNHFLHLPLLDFVCVVPAGALDMRNALYMTTFC
jgi:hypothetical protein